MGRHGARAVVVLAASLLWVADVDVAAEERATIRVLAAASLTEVVEGLAQHFGDARVEASFGASSELARQIRDGAPADVFLSASPDWIDFLRQNDLIAGEASVVARNELVCIAPQGSALAAREPSDPRALLQLLGPGDRIAIADEGVPAGDYARRALRHLGLLEAYAPRLVGQKDVRAVLNAVEQGELEAGFVYATDARVAATKRLFRFDPTTHPPIEYQAVVLRNATHPAEARRFKVFLRSAEAQALLVDAGFALP